MKTYRLLLFCLLAGACIFFAGCNSETGTQKKDIAGKWQCQGGMLNGKPYDAVKGFYVDFSETGGIESNLFADLGIDAVNAYEIKDEKILADGETVPLFTILKFEEGDLKLGLFVKASNSDFELDFKKE